MSDIIVTTQAAPATPAASKVDIYVDGAIKRLSTKDDSGFVTNYVSSDGWIPAPIIWVYASASTFTISGDLTGVYTKGVRVRWTQTTVKYGVVASSVYAAGVTTVTIVVNTDFVIANAAITAQAYSYLDNPPGWPDWFGWVPTYTAGGTMTLASILTWARYRITGKTCHFVITFNATLGGTASGLVNATAPVTPRPISLSYSVFSVNLSDAIAGMGTIVTSTGLLVFQRSDSAVFVLGAARYFMGEGFYEW